MSFLRKAWVLGSFLFLSACFDFEEEIFLHLNGSGRAVITYRVMPAFLQASFLRVPEGVPITPELVRKRLALKEGLTVDAIDTWEEGPYRYVKLHLEFSKISQLSDRGMLLDFKPYKGNYRLEIRLKSGVNPQFVHNPQLQRGVAKAVNQNGFRFKVYLPRKVEKSNADKVEWSIVHWFVPLGFFLDPEEKEKLLYAEIPMTLSERIRYFFKGR
jgi:hypothetical protein